MYFKFNIEKIHLPVLDAAYADASAADSAEVMLAAV